jgi:glycosyltransferase involved in cell wall biosynthesis
LKVVSCRPAWVRTSNRFTNLFSEAVQGDDWKVREFSWGPGGVLAPKVILLHWPDELFLVRTPFEQAKAAFKISMLTAARRLFGAKLVWLVHEAKPHDRKRRGNWATQAFLDSLDGVIYLSGASKAAAEKDIPDLKRIPALVTRHGHYCFDMETPAQPRREPGKRLDLVYFGQVRPYKNLDGLIEASKGMSPDEVRIRIIGWCKDLEFKQYLENLATDAPAVELDLRDEFVPQGDLETALDDSDGCVLPYRNILNSGAALFALSRNRPVMAPRLGTLPELQREIGEDWVDLYDGDITTEDLRAFCASVRAADAPVADLSLYEWGPIGAAIRRFFDQISQKQRAPAASPVHLAEENDDGALDAGYRLEAAGDAAGRQAAAAPVARARASEAPVRAP